MAHVFKSGKMVSNQLDAALTNGVGAQELPDGALVVLGNVLADSTYAGEYEYDLYEAAAPVAATDEVAIVDYAGISQAAIAGNQYKGISKKLVNLNVPVGTPTRIRRLYLHDKFWLGEDNFASAPTVGEFAVAAAGKFTHEPAAALPEGGYAVKILVEKDLNIGMRLDGKMYLVEVVQL